MGTKSGWLSEAMCTSGLSFHSGHIIILNAYGWISMTEWLDDHPGGRHIIESNRSKDVTPIFAPRHPSDQLEPRNIPPNVHHIGTLDVNAASEEDKIELRLKVTGEEKDEQGRIEKERRAMEERGLGTIVNMKDFEVCL